MPKPQFLTATALSALALAFTAPAAAQTNPPAQGGQQEPGDANTTPPPGATSASGAEQSDQGSISGPNDPQGTPEETTASGDIVVTAQGRAQALADVPVAVSVVNAASLERTGATDIRQITQVAPSLLVSSTGNEANGSARLRGIGTVGDNPGLESSVAVFVDGVYRSRSGVGLNELGDIERVEVLRGPQGTLFGRNASAGIISIVSKSPDLNSFSGGVQAEYGNYDYYRLAGNVNVPIGDTLAGRVDAVYVKRDGFYRDVTNGGRVNDRDRLFLRGQLLFQPDSALTVRLIGDYTKREEACCAAVYINETVAPANLNLTNPALNPIVRVLQDLDPQRYGQTPFADPFSRNIYVSRGRSYDGRTEDYGFSGQIDYDFGFGTLTSITGYRSYENHQGSDTDYGPVDILYRAPTENGGARQFKTFSQEVRLQGKAFDDRLDWLVGGYYANEDLTVRDNLRFGTQYGRFATCRLVQAFGLTPFYAPTQQSCLSATGRAVLSGQVPTVPSPLGAAGAGIVAGLNRLDTINDRGSTVDRYEQNSENFAFFTHNILELTDGLNLTLGARYTREVKTLDATFGNDNTVCQTQQQSLRPFLTTAAAAAATGIINLSCQGNSTAELNGVSISDRRKESEFTGTAILSYKVTPDLLIYGSVARGYKAGGFNLDRSALKAPVEGVGTATPRTTFADFGGAQALVGRLQFDEEINTAYEIGAKYSTGSFSLNVAAFRQEFDNFQLNTFNGSVFLVQNVNSCETDLNGADRDTAPFVPNAAATGACDRDEVRPGVISQGVEIEASLSPVRNLTVNAGLTYADTYFRNDLVGGKNGAPLDPALLRLPGDQLSNAPELVTTTSLAWTPPLGDTGLSGLFYVDQRTTSDYNTGSDLFPQKEQDGFTIVNARIGVRGPDSRWSIEAWAQNLFDIDYTQVAFNSPFQAVGTGPATGALATTFPLATYPGGTQIFSAFLAEPRTYGVTGRIRF